MREQFKAYTDEQARAAFAHSIKLDINTMILCEVVKIDFNNQTVDVQPVIKAVVKDNTSNKIITTHLGEEVKVRDVQLPVLQKVPLCYARAGSAMITMPIQVGDTGMLIISQRDISLWKEQGGNAEQGVGANMFDINDGVFLPFVANKTNKDENYSQDKLEIRYNDDKISMNGSGTVTINCNLDISGGDIVADGISLKSHVHGGVTTGGGNTGVPILL